MADKNDRPPQRRDEKRAGDPKNRSRRQGRRGLGIGAENDPVHAGEESDEQPGKPISLALDEGQCLLSALWREPVVLVGDVQSLSITAPDNEEDEEDERGNQR